MTIKPILHKKTFRKLTTDELYELLRVRSEVFVVEQNCVYQDLDGDDQKSIHLWLTIADKIVAVARVCPAGTHMKEISMKHHISKTITTNILMTPRMKLGFRQRYLMQMRTKQESK